MSDRKLDDGARRTHGGLQIRVGFLTRWLIGLVLLLVGGLVFRDFLFGNKLLLYKDIGADSVNDTYPTFVYLSDYIRHRGFPSWSFSAGMGKAFFILPAI